MWEAVLASCFELYQKIDFWIYIDILQILRRGVGHILLDLSRFIDKRLLKIPYYNFFTKGLDWLLLIDSGCEHAHTGSGHEENADSSSVTYSTSKKLDHADKGRNILEQISRAFDEC